MQTQLLRSRLLASIPNALSSGANRLWANGRRISVKKTAAEIDAVRTQPGKDIQVWFMDEARIDQKVRIPLPHELSRTQGGSRRIALKFIYSWPSEAKACLQRSYWF
jgi:hypothetical protein